MNATIFFIAFSLVSHLHISNRIPEEIIRWSETTHDFGKITQGHPVTTTFNLTNESQETIIITRAKGSCGCTATDYTKHPIQPDDTGFVKASFNAKSPGKFNKTISVYLEGHSDPYMLSITGEVIPGEN